MYSRCLDTNNGELLCFVYLEKDDLEKYKQVNEDAKRIIEKVAVR